MIQIYGLGRSLQFFLKIILEKNMECFKGIFIHVVGFWAMSTMVLVKNSYITQTHLVYNLKFKNTSYLEILSHGHVSVASYGPALGEWDTFPFLRLYNAWES